MTPINQTGVDAYIKTITAQRDNALNEVATLAALLAQVQEKYEALIAEQQSKTNP